LNASVFRFFSKQTHLPPGRKRKRPVLIELWDASLERPAPEVCSQPLYVVILAAGMARLGHGMRHRVDYLWAIDPAPMEATNQDVQTKSDSRNSVKQKVRLGSRTTIALQQTFKAAPRFRVGPRSAIPLHRSQDIDPIVGEIATPTHRWDRTSVSKR
jgi:hypothetical protein